MLLIAFLYSGWQVYQIRSEYAAAEEQYSALEQYVSVTTAPLPSSAPSPIEEQVTVPEAQTPPVSAETEAPSVAPEAEDPQWPQVDFEALGQINPDIVGWLTIEGTQIHYPVVQGEDNDFYLNHRFDGRYSTVGCLFLDVQNDADFRDLNQIIYGHYMNRQAMFHDLLSYKQQAFFDEHPAGWLITPSAVYRLHFFSGYVSDTSGDAWKTDFSGTDYLIWLWERKERSAFSSDVIPTTDSRVLTLSTCSYEFKNARFVLHGILDPVYWEDAAE